MDQHITLESCEFGLVVTHYIDENWHQRSIKVSGPAEAVDVLQALNWTSFDDPDTHEWAEASYDPDTGEAYQVFSLNVLPEVHSAQMDLALPRAA